MALKASSYALTICCKKHPNYRGIKWSKNCPSCKFLFALIRNWSIAHNNLTAVDHHEAFIGLRIESEKTPSILQFTTKTKKGRQNKELHYIGCPQYGKKLDEITGSCTCAQLARE